MSSGPWAINEMDEGHFDLVTWDQALPSDRNQLFWFDTQVEALQDYLRSAVAMRDLHNLGIAKARRLLRYRGHRGPQQ